MVLTIASRLPGGTNEMRSLGREILRVAVHLQLAQEPFEPAQMALLVAEDPACQPLRNAVGPVRRRNPALAVRDRRGLVGDQTSDHEDISVGSCGGCRAVNARDLGTAPRSLLIRCANRRACSSSSSRPSVNSLEMTLPPTLSGGY